MVPVISTRKDSTSSTAGVTSAAGRAMPKFSRNLSFMAQPCPLQAAMVVSEIKERLSPNMAPPMTAPTHSGTPKPDTPATAAAMGVRRVMVPTLVPMAVDTKQATMNSTATANRVGMMESMK